MDNVIPELLASDARRSIQSNLMVFESIVNGNVSNIPRAPLPYDWQRAL